jgi:uncharacterized membrane protein HdeD (DUF308 family)
MANTLSRGWWAILVRGLIAIAFAIVAWTRPGLTVAMLILLFGLYAIGDGVVAILGALRASDRGRSAWPLALEGVFGIALGIFALARPMSVVAVAFFLVAIWALVTGVLELIEASGLHLGSEWLLTLSGVVRIAFGVLLFVRPGAGVMTLLWITAGYALIDGILLVGLALRLRRAVERRDLGPGGLTPHPV